MSLPSPALRKVRRWFRKRGTFLFANLVAFSLSIGYMIGSALPIAQSFEVAAIDTWLAIRGRVTPPGGVVLAAIDKRTYFDLKLSNLLPWPRQVNTELLKRFKRAGARRAIFDIFFVDQGPDPVADREMSEALSLLPTFIGAYATLLSAKDTTLTEVRPLEIFATKAEAVVAMTLVGGETIRNFFVQETRKSVKNPPFAPPIANAIALASAPPLAVPDERDLIYYYGPPGTFPGYSISTILSMSDEQLISSFKDLTVIVGTQLQVDTLMKVKDSFDTPVSSAPMCGVEIHATAISNILTQQWIRRFSKKTEDVATAALAFILPLFILLLKPLRATALAVTSIGGWFVASYWIFLHGYLLPGRVVALVVVPSALFISVTHFYVILRASVHEMSDGLGVDISR